MPCACSGRPRAKFSQSNKPKSGVSPTEGVYSLTSIEITLASFNGFFFASFFHFRFFSLVSILPHVPALYARKSTAFFSPFSLCELVCLETLDTCDRHVYTALERESMELKLPPTEIITLRCCSSSSRRCMAPKSLLTHNPG